MPLVSRGLGAALSARPMARAFAIATVVAFVLRLPFALAPGFGLDFDAWLLASTARQLAEDGVWHPSRAPGYPLVECVFALLWPLGSRALTVATSLAAATAAGCGAALLARPGKAQRVPWLLPVALTTLPCVAVPAASALDMPWSLAAAAGSALALSVGRWRTAALLVGLAVLARPASVVLIPGLVWVTWHARGLRPALAATAIAGATIAPILLAPTPPPLKIGDQWPGVEHLVEVLWTGALGPGGTVVFAALMLLAVCGAMRGGSLDAPGRYSAIGAVCGLALFAALPYQANYLCVPVFMGGLALAPLAPPMLTAAAALALIATGLAVPTAGGLRAGPLRKDVWRREAQVSHVATRAREIEQMPDSTLIEAKEHTAALRFLLRGRGPEVRMHVPKDARPGLESRGRTIIEF